MKAVVQSLKDGSLAVADIPPPTLQPRGILVAVHRTLISLGTERAIIALAFKPSDTPGPLGEF